MLIACRGAASTTAVASESVKASVKLIGDELAPNDLVRNFIPMLRAKAKISKTGDYSEPACGGAILHSGNRDYLITDVTQA